MQNNVEERQYALLLVGNYSSYKLGELFDAPSTALAWYAAEGWKSNTDNIPVYIVQVVHKVNLEQAAQPPKVTLSPLQLT